MSQRTTARFEITVSDDAMRVVLVARHVSGTIRLDAAEVCKELTAQNLVVDEKLKASVAAMCEQRLAANAELVLLAGTPAADPTPPCATVYPELSAAAPPVVVKAGQTIATIAAAQPGKPGVDVFGQPRGARPTPTIDGLIGANVSLGRDGKSLVAAIDGVMHVEPETGSLSVRHAEHIEFDLYTPVPMESEADLIVAGQVREGAGVKCDNGASLYVKGDLIANATAADVLIGGAIRSGATGTCAVVAGQKLSCSTIASALVQSRGEMRVGDEIIRANVLCGGALVAPDATISASTLLVTGPMECKVVGAEDHTRTSIEIAAQPELRKLITELLPQIEQRREHVEKVRRTIRPLLHDAKRLTREQKERCTELLYDAETTEASAAGMLKRLTDLYDRFIAVAGRELTVHELIHPGVTLRFIGVETTLRMSLRGPLTIRHVTDRITPAIICRYHKSTSDLPLETRLLPDDPILLLRQHLAAEQRRLKSAA